MALANRLTGSLQVNVTHEAFAVETQDSGPTYADPIARSAIVEEGLIPFRLPSGDTITAKAKVLFLSAVPCDGRDKFTLPSGQTGRIVATDKGPVDPATGALGFGYYTQIFIGGGA